MKFEYFYSKTNNLINIKIYYLFRNVSYTAC